MFRLSLPARLLVLLGLAWSVYGPAGAAYAQDQGVAVITVPGPGAVLAGVVTISGTATHNQFQRYELAFGYSPNPTDTWFSLQEPSLTQVVNDSLGRWDTTSIVDGVYTLRLRVYWSERDYLETYVEGVRVQNATPTPNPPDLPPTATVPPTAAPLTPTPAVVGTQPVILLPPTSTARPSLEPAGPGGGDPAAPPEDAAFNPDSIRQAFLNGVSLALGVFVVLGLYAAGRTLLRARSRRG